MFLKDITQQQLSVLVRDYRIAEIGQRHIGFVHKDNPSDREVLQGLPSIPATFGEQHTSITINVINGDLYMTRYPITGRDCIWSSKDGTIDLNENPRVSYGETGLSPRHFDVERKQDTVKLEIPVSLLDQLLAAVSADDQRCEDDTWQSSEQQLLEEIVKRQVEHGNFSKEEVKVSTFDVSRMGTPADLPTGGYANDFEGDTTRSFLMQSHPDARRNVFWDEQWSPEISNRPCMVSDKDEDLYVLVQELDRRFCQLWDKIKYEGYDPDALPQVHKLYEAMGLCGVKNISKEIDSMLSEYLFERVVSHSDWHDIGYSELQQICRNDDTGTLTRLFNAGKGDPIV